MLSMLAFCRSSWGVPRTPVRQWGTLARPLVCHTATPSLMFAPREGSLKRLVAGGTAVVSRFKLLAFACSCCHQYCATVLFEQSTVISNHFLPRVVAQYVVLVWILKDSWCYPLVEQEDNVLLHLLSELDIYLPWPLYDDCCIFVLWL